LEDDAITASSFYYSGYEPWFGRVNKTPASSYEGTWRAKTNDDQQYIQVNPYTFDQIQII